jgi:hypothetical protein
MSNDTTEDDRRLRRERIEGWISEYWEQGMEYVAAIFQDRSHATGRDGGWRYEGMHSLCEGDELTILADDGAVLWSGRVGSMGCDGRLEIMPATSAWVPPGIDPAQWREWFCASPSLCAVLIRDIDPSST